MVANDRVVVNDGVFEWVVPCHKMFMKLVFALRILLFYSWHGVG